MSTRYILSGDQLNKILQILRYYSDDTMYNFVTEVKLEQYVGMSNKSLFDDITGFTTYLFDREIKPYKKLET